jgi:hypothetical protein
MTLGFRDMATGSRMSAVTIFRVASMVKLLTSQTSKDTTVFAASVSSCHIERGGGADSR